MSGTTIPLFTKRLIDFAGADGTTVVIRSLDVSGWTEGVLNVRVHDNSIGVAGSETINVRAYPISNTPEEPSVDYRDSVAGNITTVAIDGNDTAPVLLRTALAGDFGSALQITVEGANSPENATLSAELVLKD